MASRFVVDHNYEAALRRQPGYTVAMRAVTQVVKEAAESAAPVRTGYYRRHLKTIGTSVVSTDPFGHLVEFGSVNNPPYAPLRRGVLATGLRLDTSR